MGRLEGHISIEGLPHHRGLMIHLAFFAVTGPDAPAPYGGNPPAEAVTDCVKVYEQVEIDSECRQTRFEYAFTLERPPGYYFVQVRAILFRDKQGGDLLAQAEQFFFARRPVRITPEPESRVMFPVTWPKEALEELHYYGTIKPQAKRPWWRFW